MSRAEDIEARLLAKGSVRELEKRLEKPYAHARKQRGFHGVTKLRLNFGDDETSKAAAYLSARSTQDPALADALDALLHPKKHRRSASTPTHRRQPTPTPPGSPKSARLSRVDMLMLGVVDPRKETEADLRAFLKRVQDRKETGSGMIVRTVRGGSRQEELAAIAQRFLEPPVETLQARARDIVNGSPSKEQAVLRLLARDVRKSYEIDQQLVYANAQFSQVLSLALKQLTLEPAEEKAVRQGIKRLDATRTLAVRDANEMLVAAKKAVKADAEEQKSL